MLLIPAIDLKDGKCVRLRQGNMNDATVFSDDPIGVAQRWLDAGARRLHIVDLDGAAAGEPVNAGLIHRIAASHPDLIIQIGGGIRDVLDRIAGLVDEVLGVLDPLGDGLLERVDQELGRAGRGA